jgi:hypothetical protein
MKRKIKRGRPFVYDWAKLRTQKFLTIRTTPDKCLIDRNKLYQSAVFQGFDVFSYTAEDKRSVTVELKR